MADPQTANRLYQDAESKLSSAGRGGLFSFASSKSEKYEEAADKFKDAGNMYRTIRDLQKSGKSFERASEVHERYLSDSLEAAKLLQDAYKSYREASPVDAVRCLDKSIKMYTAKGNFRRAADLMNDLADTYETKMDDLPKALQCLETAITWYSDEGVQATANKARQKAGQIAAIQGDYYKAISIFVSGAEACIATGNTGRFMTKTYLLKAGLCQLATGDLVGSKKAFDSWSQIDRTFEQEREGKFLRELLDAMEQQDADKFAQIAHTWDQMTKMEDWQVTVLLTAKSHAEEQLEADFS